MILVYEHLLLRDANKPQNTACHTQQEESSKLCNRFSWKNKYFFFRLRKFVFEILWMSPFSKRKFKNTKNSPWDFLQRSKEIQHNFMTRTFPFNLGDKEVTLHCELHHYILLTNRWWHHSIATSRFTLICSYLTMILCMNVTH